MSAQLYRRGLRQPFLVGVKPVNPAAASFVGEAFTMRFIPAREDVDPMDGVIVSRRPIKESAHVSTQAHPGDERSRLEATIRRYFDGCNDADVELMASCFTPDAVPSLALPGYQVTVG